MSYNSSCCKCHKECEKLTVIEAKAEIEYDHSDHLTASPSLSTITGPFSDISTPERSLSEKAITAHAREPDRTPHILIEPRSYNYSGLVKRWSAFSCCVCATLLQGLSFFSQKWVERGPAIPGGSEDMDGDYKQGVFDECTYQTASHQSNMDNMDCSLNKDVYVLVCAVLCILAVLLCLVGTSLTGSLLCVNHNRWRRILSNAAKTILTLACKFY